MALPPRIEIESLAELETVLERRGGDLGRAVLQGLDLSGPEAEAALDSARLGGCVLLGCTLTPALSRRASTEGALLFPPLPELPFLPYRGALYSPDELFAGHSPGQSYDTCLDGRIYRHYLATGGAGAPDIVETLARRLHDHAISDALKEFIAGHRVVAIMGGHALRRDEPTYLQVARIARALARRGFLLASGGGPGAMEATHLGAHLAGRPESELVQGVALLARAPAFEPREAWLDAALELRRRYPAAPLPDGAPAQSLGVPTWLYGHEPPTPLASHIAKYFANSVREDGLLTIARAGVIFTPGSAGTIQEIFQDATQNHYKSVGGAASPMVFFGTRYWEEEKPVYPLLRRLAEGRDYARLLAITDTIDEVVRAIEAPAG